MVAAGTLAWTMPTYYLQLSVEASEVMRDHGALDREAERVLRDERECLAEVGHGGDGGAANGVGHWV